MKPLVLLHFKAPIQGSILEETKLLVRCLGVQRRIAEGANEVDPMVAARRFALSFSERFGGAASGLQFAECGWQEATAQANTTLRFLVVYLHSPAHEVHPEKSLDYRSLGTTCRPSFFSPPPPF